MTRPFALSFRRLLHLRAHNDYSDRDLHLIHSSTYTYMHIYAYQHISFTLLSFYVSCPFGTWVIMVLHNFSPTLPLSSIYTSLLIRLLAISDLVQISTPTHSRVCYSLHEDDWFRYYLYENNRARSSRHEHFGTRNWIYVVE